MGPQNRYAQFAVVIVLTIILQGVLIAADCTQSPLRTAEEFVRNYYYLDPAMQKQLCSDLAAGGEAVREYLYKMRFKATQRGFDSPYLRRMFTKIHLETLSQNDTSAQIRIEGHTRTAINPVYMVIGKLFRLSRDYPVQVTLDLIKEDGRWRVCGDALGLKS